MRLDDTTNKIKLTTEAFIICNDEILLFQRDPNAKAFPGFWSIPGGHVNTNEDVLTACIREIDEETGLKVTTNDIKLKYVALHNHIDRQEIWHIHGFLVKIANKHLITNSIEGIAQWTPINKIGDMQLFPPVAHYIKHVLTNNSGLLYTASDWENAQLVKVVNESVE